LAQALAAQLCRPLPRQTCNPPHPSAARLRCPGGMAVAASMPQLRGREALDFLAAEGRPRSPLAWATPPQMELAREGHSAWIVRTPNNGNQSQAGRGTCRLVREFDLRPSNPGGASAAATLLGQGADRRHIKLRVLEKDLRRCSGDLEQLKRCDLDSKPHDLCAASSRCSTPSGETPFVRRVASMPKLMRRRSTVGERESAAGDNVGSATPMAARSTPLHRGSLSSMSTPSAARGTTDLCDGGATPVGSGADRVVRRRRSEALLRGTTL